VKKISALLLPLILILTLVTACAAAPANSPVPTSAAPSTMTAFPVTVTDQLGRSVTLEQKPERLVSGYYISTSLLIALGIEDQLVGIEAKASQRPIYALSAPELLDLPNVGTAKDFSIEGTLALEPDLVILPARLKDAIEILSGMGLEVLAVNPEDGELLAEAIRLVGLRLAQPNARRRFWLKVTIWPRKLSPLLLQLKVRPNGSIWPATVPCFPPLALPCTSHPC